jgi:hypothetical protein
MLRFKKRGDGSTAFTLVRADGSRTWSTLGPADGYGPIHDLAHYVVESYLGLTGGFLGLIARGWSIEDFEVRALERIRREPDWTHAGLAEGLAGAISGEEMSGQRLTSAADLDAAAGEAGSELAALSGRPITDDDLDAMRAALSTLRRRWDAIGPGETLELRFVPGARPHGSGPSGVPCMPQTTALPSVRQRRPTRATP